MKKNILSLIKNLPIIVSICCISYVFIVIILLGFGFEQRTVYRLIDSESTFILAACLSLGLVILLYLWKNNFFKRKK